MPIGKLSNVTVGEPAGQQIGEGIASLAQIPDLIRQHQLSVLMNQMQRNQTSQQMQDILSAQASANPKLLDDPQFRAMLKSNAQLGGLLDPIKNQKPIQTPGGMIPAQQLAPGNPQTQAPGTPFNGATGQGGAQGLLQTPVPPTVAPAMSYAGINNKGGEYVDTNLLFGVGGQNILSKNRADIQHYQPGASRDAEFKVLSGGRDPSALEEQELNALPFVPDETQMSKFSKQQAEIVDPFVKQIPLMVKNGQTGAIQSVASSTYNQLYSLGLQQFGGDKAQANEYALGIMEPYMSNAIEQLSPAQRSKVESDMNLAAKRGGYYQALANRVNATLQYTLEEDRQKVELIKQQANKTRQQAAEIAATTNPKVKLIASQISRNFAEISKWRTDNAKTQADADYYRDKAKEMEGDPTVMDPSTRNAGIQSLTRQIDSTDQTIRNIDSQIGKYQSSMNRLTNNPQATQWLNQLAAQRTQLVNERNQYTQALSTITGQPAAPAASTYTGDVTTPAAPPESTPSTNPNVVQYNGKTYYRNPNDPNDPKLYTQPPQ